MPTTTITETITRAQLVAATENAIVTTADRTDEGVPDKLAEAVREIARTATRITQGWSSLEGDCGCLVGTLRMRRGDSPVTGGGYHPGEHRLGVEFVSALIAQEPRLADVRLSTVLEVID